MKYEIEYASYTSCGSREINEDSLGTFQNQNKHCFVLCDGLGGHGMGDVASSLVVDVFQNQFSRSDELVNFLGQTFIASQDILMAEQKVRGAGRKMKTTATAVVTDEKSAYIGHIGDSRVYIFQRNKVKTRTLDHSIPQMMVLSKELKESDIRHHPQRNIVLRVLGVEWEEPMYELMVPIPLKKCQAFLLCSDGFWELIEEKAMCDFLKKATSVQEWLKLMVDEVNMNGLGTDMDNFSAIAVWIK